MPVVIVSMISSSPSAATKQSLMLFLEVKYALDGSGTITLKKESLTVLSIIAITFALTKSV